MNILDRIELTLNETETQNGAKAFLSSLNPNVDLFVKNLRFKKDDEIATIFLDAFESNEDLALANLLHLMDIRGGKGERRVTKLLLKLIINKDVKYKNRIIDLIGEIGRYDMLLGILNYEYALKVIKTQFDKDMKSNTPSLLGKWLPSITTKANNKTKATLLKVKNAKIIAKYLKLTDKEYRKSLVSLRSKIKIVETTLSQGNRDNINFSTIPAKAMIKYNHAFNKLDSFSRYKESLKSGDVKINTEGLTPADILYKYTTDRLDEDSANAMWKQQKDVIDGLKSNVIVVADTSGSMHSWSMGVATPIASSISLAMYIAERNNGEFKNKFIIFSESPELIKLNEGSTFTENLKKFHSINASNTDIDKVFRLILEHTLTQDDLPSHIVIVSDMQFDEAVSGQTNYEEWTKRFKNKGFALPKIVFWDVDANTKTLPVLHDTSGAIQISGYSTNNFKGILTSKVKTPQELMLETLKPYVELLQNKK